jgi:hypothetical protein
MRKPQSLREGCAAAFDLSVQSGEVSQLLAESSDRVTTRKSTSLLSSSKSPDLNEP